MGSRASCPCERVPEDPGTRGPAPLGMKLDPRKRAALHRRDEGSLVVDLGDGDRLGGRAGEGVGEVDVLSVETFEQLGRPDHAERVPAHVRDSAAAQARNAAGQNAEPAPALLALLEEELHAEADAENRPARGLRVADTGDHGQRRLANDLRRRRRGCRHADALEPGANAAQVAGAVVGEHDHNDPFVDRTGGPSSAWPNASPTAASTSSTVWCSSTSRSPPATTSRSSPPWNAS